MQDTYLSPGQATRLHTLSSAVSLPDSESDEEPEMPLHANSHAAGLETAAPAEEGRALSITEGVQSTASEGSPVSDDDSASSISGMSGVSSVAATEVVDGEQDAAGVPGRSFGVTCSTGHAALSVYEHCPCMRQHSQTQSQFHGWEVWVDTLLLQVV